MDGGKSQCLHGLLLSRQAIFLFELFYSHSDREEKQEKMLIFCGGTFLSRLADASEMTAFKSPSFNALKSEENVELISSELCVLTSSKYFLGCVLF